ncbi:MAG: prolyl-tRNA synthetase associated domain-containing protein [Patescibacteria group bacterium]
MKLVFTYLKNLNIDYTLYEHPAVFTVAEAEQHRPNIVFGENKNLFLRNKKGNKNYLITIKANKRLDLKNLTKILNEDRLSFATENRLQEYLNLSPGSVSPFGLINDKQSLVEYILDEDLLQYSKLGFHPNINTQTVILNTMDFKKFLESLNNKISFLKL